MPAHPGISRHASQRRPVSELAIALGCALGEFAGLAGIGSAIAQVYVGMFLGTGAIAPIYLIPLFAGPLLVISYLRSQGMYEPGVLQYPERAVGSLFRSVALVFAGLVVFAFLGRVAEEFSRVWFVSWTFASIGWLLLWRAGYAGLLHQLVSQSIPMTRIAIVGDAGACLRLKSRYQVAEPATHIVGLYTTEEETGPGRRINGTVEDLLGLGRQVELDRVVIAKEAVASGQIKKLMRSLSVLPCEILVYPEFLGDTINVTGVSSLDHTRLLKIQNRPISQLGLLVKSVEDRILAALGLVVLAPLFAIVAIAIKLDSKGPVFFRQIRHGYNQREINVWKFRTMTVMECGNAFKQATRGDNRITRIGGFLRRTSIDELPQLINVLKGEMSIVGPRPHPVAMNAEFSRRLQLYENRHKVKPGITGLAQVNGYRGPTNEPHQIKRRIELDLEYIENWSLWLDLKIILATPLYGLFSRNAF